MHRANRGECGNCNSVNVFSCTRVPFKTRPGLRGLAPRCGLGAAVDRGYYTTAHLKRDLKE